MFTATDATRTRAFFRAALALPWLHGPDDGERGSQPGSAALVVATIVWGRRARAAGEARTAAAQAAAAPAP